MASHSVEPDDDELTRTRRSGQRHLVGKPRVGNVESPARPIAVVEQVERRPVHRGDSLFGNGCAPHGTRRCDDATIFRRSAIRRTDRISKCDEQRRCDKNLLRAWAE
jgi:hypothetical protein